MRLHDKLTVYVQKRIILLETKLFCMDMKAVTIVLTHYRGDMTDYHGDHVYIMCNTDFYQNYYTGIV